MCIRDSQYTATVARADPDPEAASAFIEMAARLVENTVNYTYSWFTGVRTGEAWQHLSLIHICAAEHGKAVPCPHVVAQHAGQRKQRDEHEVHQPGLLAAAAGQLHAAADDLSLIHI